MTQYPPPPTRKPPIWPWLLGGCAVLLVAGIGFIIAIFVLVGSSMRSSEPYEHALALARPNPQVAEALGTPLEPGYFVQGSLSTNANGSGEADLKIPISGPKGKASIHVVGKRTDDRWSYSTITVTPEKGEAIDLLNSPAQ